MTLPAWLSALVLAAAMWGAVAVGWQLGKRWPGAGKGPPSPLYGATLATLGLLLAFTFSITLSQNVQRRERAVEDANAIGDFYTSSGFVDEPLRSRLQKLVRRYLERRVMLSYTRDGDAAVARELPIMEEMQGEMQYLVRDAVAQRSPIAIPLVNNLNALKSRHTARLAAFRHRLPPIILALLAVAAFLSMLIVGVEHGAIGERNVVPVIVFALLVSLVVWVTLALNQPGTASAITVNREPFEQLLRTMRP